MLAFVSCTVAIKHYFSSSLLSCETILARLRPNDRNDELPSSEHPGGHERGDEDVLGKPGGQGDHPLLC